MQRRFLATFLGAALVILLVNLSFAQAPLQGGANHLACVNYNDGPGSSDMTLIVQLDVDGEIVVNEGHSVAYVFLLSTDQALAEAIGTNWMDATYDDSGWDQGTSGVGFADNDDNTVTPTNGVAIYTRYRFDIANALGVSSVIFRADYDDAYACWLNGVEIARSANIAGRELTWDVGVGGGFNHGSTELVAGSPNPDRQYQEEVQVDFVGVPGAAVEPAGKLATSWASIKAGY
jgi:hypothetical protein